MADRLLTLKQLNGWLDDLDESLKASIVRTPIGDKQGREDLYCLYQAAQLLRARMLSDFAEDVEFKFNLYDEKE